MATWEDLDSECGSEKEEAEEEANVAVGLVATVTSEAEPDSDSKDENEVYAKIFKEELIESLKELLTHFEVRTNELIDLKEKYIVLIKQQESTLLDLKASEEGLRGFDFICRTYEEKLKYLRGFDFICRTSDQSKNTFKYKSSHPEDQIIGNKESPRRTRLYFRPEEFIIGLLSVIEPTTVDEALSDDGWILAMQEELNQF